MTDAIIFRPKIILLGEAGAGKTSFVNKLNIEGMRKKFYKKLGVTRYTVPIGTSLGVLECNFWDTCGQERLGVLRDMYFYEADLALLFFDLTSRDSYIRIARWYALFKIVTGTENFILVGNKLDSPERVIPVDKIQFHNRLHIPYCEISCKTNYGITKLITTMCQTILAEQGLTVTTGIRLTPAEEKPDMEAMQEAERRYNLAKKQHAAAPQPHQNQNQFQHPFGRQMNQNFEFEETLLRDLGND